MTNAQLATAIDTASNRAAYAASSNPSLFVQEAIEGMGVATEPCSALCDFVEDALSAPVTRIKLSSRIGGFQ